MDDEDKQPKEKGNEEEYQETHTEGTIWFFGFSAAFVIVCTLFMYFLFPSFFLSDTAGRRSLPWGILVPAMLVIGLSLFGRKIIKEHRVAKGALFHPRHTIGEPQECIRGIEDGDSWIFYPIIIVILTLISVVGFDGHLSINNDKRIETEITKRELQQFDDGITQAVAIEDLGKAAYLKGEKEEYIEENGDQTHIPFYFRYIWIVFALILILSIGLFLKELKHLWGLVFQKQVFKKAALEFSGILFWKIFFILYACCLLWEGVSGIERKEKKLDEKFEMELKTWEEEQGGGHCARRESELCAEDCGKAENKEDRG